MASCDRREFCLFFFPRKMTKTRCWSSAGLMTRPSREAPAPGRCKPQRNTGMNLAAVQTRKLLDGASCPSPQPRASVSSRRRHMSSVLQREADMQRAERDRFWPSERILTEETIPGKTSQRRLKEVDLFIGEFVLLLEFPHHVQFQIFIFHHTF